MTIPVADTHIAAMRDMVDVASMQSFKVIERMTVFDHERVHPLIVDFVKEVLKECRRRNIPIRPFELYRSPKRQIKLKAAGFSNAGAMSSPHQYGCAVDLIHQIRLWDGARTVHWEALHALFSEIARKRGIKLRWGGHFKVRRKGKLVPFWDPAHFEIENWREWREYYRRVGADEYWQTLERMRGAPKSIDWQIRYAKPPT